MREWLGKIRTPKKEDKLSVQLRNSLLVLLLGIALGIFSKWLDNTPINDAIWWQHILGVLDLGNVFSEFAVWLVAALAISVYSKTPLRAGLNVFLFFLGMCGSYHFYTVAFCGFNPRRYMMIWYTITLLSPLFSFICWYAKGKTKLSSAISMLILSVMLRSCFSIGFWYFDFRSVIDTLLFFASVAVLQVTPKRTVISLAGATVLAFVFRLVLYM